MDGASQLPQYDADPGNCNDVSVQGSVPPGVLIGTTPQEDSFYATQIQAPMPRNDYPSNPTIVSQNGAYRMTAGSDMHLSKSLSSQQNLSLEEQEPSMRGMERVGRRPLQRGDHTENMYLEVEDPNDFDAIMQGNVPERDVLVLLFAPWCPHSAAMRGDLANEHIQHEMRKRNGSLRLLVVHVQNGEGVDLTQTIPDTPLNKMLKTASKYPTMVLLTRDENGQPAEARRAEGRLTPEALRDFVTVQ